MCVCVSLNIIAGHDAQVLDKNPMTATQTLPGYLTSSSLGSFDAGLGASLHHRCGRLHVPAGPEPKSIEEASPTKGAQSTIDKCKHQGSKHQSIWRILLRVR